MSDEEKSVLYTEEMLQGMVHSDLPVAVYEYRDKRVKSVIISDGFCQLFGFKDKKQAYELMDKDMFHGTHPDDATRIADASVHFAADREASYNVIYRTHTLKDKDMAVVHAQGKHITTDDGQDLCLVWYVHEGVYDPENQDEDVISAFNIRLNQDSSMYKSKYDTLTALPNMTHFFELADAGRRKIWSEGKDAVFVFFDMCGMKAFNRSNGYTAGDALLYAFAKILVRKFSNENCCRFGQDHFAIYTADDNIEDTVKSIFEEAKALNDGNSIPIRAGIYSNSSDEGIDVSAVCDYAKMACDTKRNSVESAYVFFNTDMLINAQNRIYIIENIDKAIENGWIEVYYQPIVRISNGLVCEEESLSRWNDPIKGFMTPRQFVPVLEDAKLIYKLDLYVIEQTLAKMKKQKEEGRLVISGSVNLSRSDFAVCDIVEEVRKRVDDAGISHNMINIEITESAVGSDFEYMREQIDRFHELGFNIWIDDFGSGYSSLYVLQKINFDLIKFDMEFMRQYHYDTTGKSRIIIAELMKLAMSLGVDTITEGVEDAAQVEFLREIGCSKIQGFYYSRPIPYDETRMIYGIGLMNGVEDPEESEYYQAISNVNLFNPSGFIDEKHGDFFRNFDTLPMAIVELDENRVSVLRYTKSFKELMSDNLQIDVNHENFNNLDLGVRKMMYINALRSADSNTEGWSIIDVNTDDGKVIKAFIRKLSENPVTHAAAYVAVGLVVNY